MPDLTTPDPTPRTVTGPLPAATAAAVRDLATAAAAHDGVPPLSEQPLLWLTGGGPDVVHLLVSDPGAGALAGYAQVDLRDPARATAEVVVAPAARRRGTGTALLAAALGAARDRGGDAVDVWAHGDVAPARALAAARGLPVVRELWQMALDPLTAPDPGAAPLPDGVTVRAFEPGRDEDAWVAVNARAFAQHPEQGRLTRADLEARKAEPWFDPAGFLLAEEAGALLGFGWTKVAEPGEGEIYALGVDPAAQGRRLGPALTARMLAHLAARGVPRVVLYTEGDNAPAVRVYRAAGFDRSALDMVYRLS
ncbi:mycothiol synthase [Cellulomonas pakistanensis]|uniref:Mycothiol acetyltransferase n=1 Tax=Cellulomonas pakistanensis TaxID=992287 RepID=A0A919PA81_9CELL|nr:mycothiol synthase [Cellulomonas pakistanensis]GIG37260.1 mycothiol acetyltransferase [Cellulomonas pakistanensis]